MKRSPACDAIVKNWEGYHRALPGGGCEAYPDVAHGWDVPTIGFGTTYYASVGIHKFGRRSVRQGDDLTRAEAESELDAELDNVERELNNAIKYRVTQSMFDAMCSFAFNLGIAGSAQQIERINAGKYEECARSFYLYVNANGEPYQGLISRRNGEEALFRKDGMIPGVPEPEPVPLGEGRPYVPCPVPLPWSATLRPGEIGLAVYQLQFALIGLGFLAKPKGGELVGDVFNEHVEHAVKTMQHEHGLLMDGVVGNVTRGLIAKLLTAARKPKAPAPADGIARLTSDNSFYDGAWAGLRRLTLQIGDDTFSVASGARGAQTLRRPQDPRSVPGNLEPIPQGRYAIGGIEFVNGKDNYEGSWGHGLGPVWVGLDAEFSDDRGAFGFHQDHNIGSSPGSAGCVVFFSVADLKRFVAAQRKHDPKVLSVDWNL